MIVNIRRTAFEYYSNGALQRVVTEPGPDDQFSDLAYLQKQTDLVRDQYGNVTSTITIAGTESSEANPPRIEQIIYAEDGYTPGWYPIEKINAKGQRTKVDYDTRFGELIYTEDPNGIKTDWRYDDFGRLAFKRDGDRTETTVDVRTGFGGLMQVETTVEGGKQEVVHYDYYGRVIRVAQKGTFGADLVSDIAYDAFGRIDLRSRPHYLNEVDESQARVTFSFDARGREKTKSWVDGSGPIPVTISTRSCYAGTLRCTRNARGFTSCEDRDQLGRTLRSWDPEPIANAEDIPESALPSCEDVLSIVETWPPTVQYSYGEFLEKIEDAHGNVTRIKLDRYGRRTQLSDPDSGVESTFWNAFGELQSTIDANGQFTGYEYDALGRTVVRHDAATVGPGQVTRWYYDGEDPEDPALEPGELIGTLTESRSPEGHAKTYEYNEDGQVTQVKQLLAGETEPLTVRYSNYEFGRPETIHYPDSDGQGLAAVRHNYGPYGHLLSVGVSQQTPYWELTNTDAFDLPTEEHFGNGALSTYLRDNLSRVQGMADGDGNGTVLRLATLAHDAGGNVIRRAEANQVEELGYDQLDRLTSSTINDSSTPRETRYDDIGNITFRTEIGPYGYQAENAEVPGVFLNPIKPHAVNSVGTTLQDATFYAYDDAGQMTGRVFGESIQQMSWTPFGKISQLWTGSGDAEDGFGVVTFGYDAEGQRVLKTTEDETTTYMLGLYERRERASETEHVFYVSNGRRVFLQVAMRTDGTSSEGELAYLHGDVIGSPEIITGADGSVLDRRSYGAFGAERNPSNWLASDADASSVRRGFTGHEEDREYDLVNMIGRLYDARIGRFLSSDPLATLASSQGLNRYSYVLNNPLKYVDPSGYMWEAAEGGEGLPPYEDVEVEEINFDYESEASAQAASNETGPNSNPFSQPDAAANADATTMDTAGAGELWQDEAGQIWRKDGENYYYDFEQTILHNGLDGPVGPRTVLELMGVGVMPAGGKILQSVRAAEDASRGASETVDLYRAVGVREFDDVMSSGMFRPNATNSMEGRQFAFTLEEAMKYADTDRSKVAILKATIEKSALEAFDFSNRIDPHIFNNGVITVQPGAQSSIFHQALQSIEQAF